MIVSHSYACEQNTTEQSRRARLPENAAGVSEHRCPVRVLTLAVSVPPAVRQDHCTHQYQQTLDNYGPVLFLFVMIFMKKVLEIKKF